MNKIKRILVVILVSVILLGCFGFLGYFGAKTLRRTQLRVAARKAYDAEDWKKAEKLLSEYVGKDHDSEEDFVRLAKVYRHFGSTEEEMRCWHRACTLNPLKPEYWDTYTECAMNARSFTHLYSSLSRKIGNNEALASKDKMMYLICAVMTNRGKDAEKYYELMLREDPEVFRENDLAQYAEFLVTFKKRLPEDRSKFLKQVIHSSDPVVKLESILFYLVDLELSEEDADSIREQNETMLKQAVELNRFVGTPFLSKFYFSQMRFSAVIDLAEPYLADIVHVPLSILYAESCVYGGYPEKLVPLAEKYRSLGRKYNVLASYFDALYDFSQGAEKNDDLVKHMQEVGNSVQTDLAQMINLQIALNNDNMEKIVSSTETIMRRPPFFYLQDRARSAVRHYMWKKVEEDPSFVENPRMVRLAQILLGNTKSDPFLMRIILSDLYQRDVLTPQIVQDYLDAFPYDPYLLQVAADFELFRGNPEQCLEYTERFYSLKEEKRSNAFDFLHMLALELMGKIDDAAKEYTSLVDNTEMDRGILYRYFRFCVDHKRRPELAKMAERLNTLSAPELKALAPFFQAEDLLLQGKKEDALALLETAKTDQPDFALRAADLFCTYDRLDQALSRYLELVGKHPDQRLILANIAEVYTAKGMKEEALSYAKRSWDSKPDDELAQFVYAKMLAANGRYQDAERVVKMPYRVIELPDRVKELWTDIMLHCVQEDFENRLFSRALERANHYLILYPDDPAFLDFKTRSEQELKKGPEYLNLQQKP